MFIKHFFDIRPEELRLIESPRVAAETVRKVLSSPHSPRASLFFYSIPGFGSGTKNSEYPRLLDKLASGELCLIYSGIGSDTPRSPAVVWQDRSGKSSGGWRCALFGESIPGLERTVETLNRKGVTPSDIGRARSPGGDARSNPDQHAGPSDHKPSLPLGATASVLPIAAAAGNESQPDDSKGVHVVLGLFTDGTLNNYDNIEEFREKAKRCLDPDDVDLSDIEACRDRLALELGDSYANAPTNVIKLFDLYEEGFDDSPAVKTLSVKVYEPGAGTKSGDADSLIGMATGLGDTGVIEQVSRLFLSASDIVKARLAGGSIRELTVDFFGFSRGAAAARHAVQQIVMGESGELAKAFQESGLKWPSSVRVRFVGLFDTVAGIINPYELDLSARNGRNNPVGLYLDPDRIDQVVHLVATDERRANFSLNSVRSTDGSLPSNFREISLPGAHSDVGGGYHESQTESVLLSPPLSLTGSDTHWPEETGEWDNLESLRLKVESEGWIGPYSLPISDGIDPDLALELHRNEHPAPDGHIKLMLRMTRKVKGGYSLVSLGLMHRIASDAGVPFDDIHSRAEMNVPEELKVINGKVLETVANAGGTLELHDHERAFLRQRFVHHSDHYNVFEWLVGGRLVGLELPAQEFLHPMRPTASRERTIYFNEKEG